MKNYLTFLVFLFTLTVFGQVTQVKSNIDSGGAITQNSGLQMLFTIGEVVVQEKTVGTLQISEGFISPEILSALGIDDFTASLKVSVFPNPTSDLLNLTFDKESNYLISIYDLNGKLIFNKTLTNVENQISISQFTAGIYNVIIEDSIGKMYSNVKLIKK